MLTAWDAPDADHGTCKGPIDVVGLRISGVDVSWLAEQPCEEASQEANA
jgi:hypothetical protein